VGTDPRAGPSTTPPGSPPRGAGSLAALAGAAEGNAGAAVPAKRRYVVDAADAEVVKRIKQAEIELEDRNSVLRGTKPNVRAALPNARRAAC
jgi:parafibromin